MITAQYTYTTTDGVGVLGGATYGWKVKEAKAVGPHQLPEDDLRWATGRLGVFPAVAIPSLATQEQIRRLPRTVRLEISDSGLLNLTHRAPAGKEATGRPNLFVHGVLLRRGDGPTLADDSTGAPLRPCDLLAAAEWLEPVGVEAVNDARLADPPSPAARQTVAEAAMEWFSDHRGAQAILLAGFEEACRTNKTLVVVADEPEAGAACVHQLQTVLLAEAAWALPFSTYESLSSGSTAASLLQGVRLVVVPRQDKEAAGGLDGVILLDVGAPRAFQDGQWLVGDTSVPVGPWTSFWMQVISAALDDEVMEALDWLGLACGHSADQVPLWGAPAAFLLLSDDDALCIDGLLAQAVGLAIQEAPTELAIPENIKQQFLARSGAVSQAGLGKMTEQLASLDSRWRPGATSVLADMLYSAYLAAWIEADSGRGQAWLPKRVQLSPDALAMFMGSSLRRATALLETGSMAEAAELATWALDLADRNGVRTAADCQPIEASVRALLMVLINAVAQMLSSGQAAVLSWLKPVPVFAWDLAFAELVTDLIVQNGLDDPKWAGSVYPLFQWLDGSGVDFAQVTSPEQLGTMADVDLARATFQYWTQPSADQAASGQQALSAQQAMLRAATLMWRMRRYPFDYDSLRAFWQRITRVNGLDEWLACALVIEMGQGSGQRNYFDFVNEVLNQTPLGRPGHLLAVKVVEAVAGWVDQPTKTHQLAYCPITAQLREGADSLWVPSTETYRAAVRGWESMMVSAKLQRSCRNRMAQLFILQPLGPLLRHEIAKVYVPDLAPLDPSGLTGFTDADDVWTNALDHFSECPEAHGRDLPALLATIACRWACAPLVSRIDAFASWLTLSGKDDEPGGNARAYVSGLVPKMRESLRREAEERIDNQADVVISQVAALAKEQGVGRRDQLEETLQEVRKRLSGARKTLLGNPGSPILSRLIPR